MKTSRFTGTLASLTLLAMCLCFSACVPPRVQNEQPDIKEEEEVSEEEVEEAPEEVTKEVEEEITEVEEEELNETYSEGDNTNCEITVYKEYRGEHESYFLSRGDKIAVISPSALPNREQVDATINGLKEWGYVPVEGKYVCTESRQVKDVVRDFKWALTDPEIKAIFCVRGGFGATYVMDSISADMIKRAEKPIIGYSDITVYHSAWTYAGLPSMHACMSVTFTDLAEECREAERQMMMGFIPSYKCETEEKCIPGEATGILIGGNLATFTTVVDTVYDCTKTGQPYVLFFEDIAENLTHIQRYLTVLKNTGVLDNAEAIIFGEWTDIPTVKGGEYAFPRGGKFSSVADMIRKELLVDLNIPVAFGFPAGHANVNYPLLMGEKVHVNISENSYTIDWE
ncbi:S66 peptidase family protein [Butyrivibrio sp. VCD2006]|uniref:S66 peptidase family protein n=1 Tax=Butyrivibrio sp. VCD2006 TaxID=1280664 RepID=UPI000403ACE6|nr:LD-carboxypeptidase [Butyrivibrio sp. VCD2006]